MAPTTVTRRPVTSKPSTAAPTPVPTVSVATILTYELQNELKKVSLNGTILYQDIVVGGTLVRGGCNPWLIGTGSNLNVIAVSQKVLSLSLVAVDVDLNRQSVKCYDPAAVLKIMNAVAFSSKDSSVKCQGSSWKSKVCGDGQISLCVDCADPCGVKECPNLLSLNPCGSSKGSSYGCSASTASVNAYRVLSTQYQPFAVAPSIKAMTYTADRTSATVSVSLSADGTVYCAAYPVRGVPTSVTSIIILYHMDASTGKVASVTIDGLAPITTYDVFCTTQSTLGDLMVLSDTLKSKLTVTTACCKAISIALSIRTLYKGANAINAVHVSFESAPDKSILLTLGTSDVNNRRTENVLVPSGMSLTKDSTDLSGTFSISSTSSSVVSNMTIVATISGPSASQYIIEYVTSPLFSVISNDKAPTTPTLSSAQFSSDGLTITAVFSADTDKGRITVSYFPCSSIFRFPGSGSAVCQWSSLSIVNIVLGSDGKVQVGQALTLLPGQVKAACVSTADLCKKWNFAATVLVTVTAPSNAMTPIVIIIAPRIIGPCDTYSLDLSNSEGSGGRTWSNVTYSVTSSGDASAAQSFLNTRRVGNGLPIAVPFGLFPIGVSNINVNLCNFLNQCGQGSAKLIRTADSAPLVSISGSKLVRTTTAAGLLLDADSYVSTCSGTFARTNLLYTWAGYKNGVQDFSLVSSSSQFYSYKLKPYSLSVDSLYSIVLTVLDTKTKKSSTDTVQVEVVASNIVAIITGSSSRSVLLASTVTLDASFSYDQDRTGISGEAAGLKFSWSCVQTAPLVSASCGIKLPANTLSPKLVLFANDLSAGTTSVIKVVVSDATRSATSTVSLTVQTADKPLVGIISSFPIKVNAGRSLAITGSIQVQQAATITWSTNDTGVALASVALSPVTQGVLPGLTPITFLLAANSLSPGSTHSFQLSCVSNVGGAVSTANIIVTVNQSPQPGKFTVIPSTGRELLDLFTMTASLWSDPDLPLTYSFGYISATGLLSNVKPASSISFGSSILPAGKDIQGYNVSCQLQVFDYYLANSIMNTMIKVTEVKMNIASLESLLFSTAPSTNQQTSTSTAAQQLIQVITEKINKQTCTSAPDCTALNRQQCNAVKNTCGPCFTGSYVGESGSHNTKCVAVRKRSLATEGEGSGSKCSNSSACGGWNECINSVCAVPSKTCANDCNGNGKCVFASADTGDSQSTCLVTSTQCKAQCSCNQGFKGLFCDLTDADLIANQNLKHFLAIGIVNSTTNQDASLATVTNWISNVVSLTQNYADLSATSISLISDTLASILTDSVSLALPYDSVSDILTAVDNIVMSMSQNVAVSDITRKMTTLLQRYSNFVLAQMVHMQYDEGSLYDSFRSVNSVRPVANGTVVLSSTVTAAEQFTGLAPDTVSLKTGAGVTEVKIGMVVMRSSSLGSALSSQVHSNPLMVSLPDLSVCSSSRCAFNVVLQTIDNTSYISGASSKTTFVTACGTDTSRTVYSCPNGLNVTAVCSGRPGVVTSTCPYLVSTPSCARLSMLSAFNDVCHSTSHSASQTTCQCSVPISAFTTSRSLNMLAAPIFPGEVISEAVTVGGTLQLATVTTFSTIQPPQPPTTSPSKGPVSYDGVPYTVPTIQIITIVLTVVGACFAFGVALFFYLNKKRPTPWFAVVSTRKAPITVSPMTVEALEPAADSYNDSDWALPACKYRRKSEVETYPVNQQKPDLRLIGTNSNRAISPDYVPDFGILPDTENTEFGVFFLGPQDI